MRRLLVTGSRTWNDLPTLHDALSAVLLEWHPTRPTDPAELPVLVHGDARGADRIAGDVWLSWGLPMDPIPARWSECGPRCPLDGSCRRTRGDREWCSQAGHRRNRVMVDDGPDLVLAFIRNRSGGASQCAAYAEERGLEVRRYLA